MASTTTWRAAKGCADSVVRLHRSMEQPRKTTPEDRPIQCRMLRVRTTTVPASWREGSTAKADGASTKERKIIPPIHTIRERKIRKRRTLMARDYRGFK